MIVKIRHSANTGNVPLVLSEGELTINTADQKLYYRHANGAIVALANGVNLGSANSIISGVLGVARGGTGQTAITVNGSLLIGNTVSGGYDVRPITQGNGIIITNSKGAISIATTKTLIVQNATGTVVDFLTIPVGVFRITVGFVGISTNGTSNPCIRLGDSGGLETTGYLGTVINDSGTTINMPTGFVIQNPTTPALIMQGQGILNLVNPLTNTWSWSFSIGNSNIPGFYSGTGTKALSGILDRIRLTTLGGINTFDAGLISIMYE